MSRNIILRTDSYKLTHWKQYPKDTQTVYSYFESRVGAKFPLTVFFGLQPILDSIAGNVLQYNDILKAKRLSAAHFGNDTLFNEAGWQHIYYEHNCRLPLRIKAVPEGTPVPVGNVMMTVENTCPKCYWLTNAVESLLTHVWYPSTVASLSYDTKKRIKYYLEATGCTLAGLPFMLHDFGYRGVSSDESAEAGGAAHLTSFCGTDTLLGMELALDCYNADLTKLAFSVPATEHSVMTALGSDGEMDIVGQLLKEYPTGILSVVADSYNIYEFVKELGRRFKPQIMARNGVFVVRPDSVTPQDTTPASLVENLTYCLVGYFGATRNAMGYDTLDPHVRLLWGDGIDSDGISAILSRAMGAGFAADNYVFGMGGGLLQKVNRDTQRFAFKASAMLRNGAWYDVQKMPLDKSKASKTGKLALTADMRTVKESEANSDLLQTVFLNGEVTKRYNFEDIRSNVGNW